LRHIFLFWFYWRTWNIRTWTTTNYWFICI